MPLRNHRLVLLRRLLPPAFPALFLLQLVMITTITTARPISAASASAAPAFPLNETSHLNVYIPKTLHNFAPNGIPHKMANFGRHPTHGSLSLPVYYYFELCEFPVNTSKGYPSRPVDATTGKQRPWEGPFILMTARGGCTFTTKARHAQMAGASAVIVADTSCLCSDEACKKNNTWKDNGDAGTCEAHHPYMADDGSGGDVTIPGFLLYKNDAVHIKEAIVDHNQAVLMSIKWHKPLNDHTVNFGMWMDITDTYTADILEEVGSIVNALGDQGRFFPHYTIHNGTRTNCGGDAAAEGGDANAESNQLCYNMCTNNGRYCVPTYRENGTAAVLEVLRRSCIWTHGGLPYSGSGGGGDTLGLKWWLYVSYYREKCKSFTDEGCVADAYRYAQLDPDTIDNCMADTGDPHGDDANHLLDEELRAQTEYGATLSPTIWVNHRILTSSYSNDLDGPSGASSPSALAVLRTICDSYVPNSIPKVCRQCLDQADPMGCVTKNYAIQPPTRTKRRHSFLLWCGFMVSLGFFAFAYKRYREGEEAASFPGLAPTAYAMLREDGGGTDNGGFAPPDEI